MSGRTKWSELREPVMADPRRRARIAARERDMEAVVALAMDDVFVAVLSGLGSLREAKSAFDHWLADHNVSADDIGIEDIHIDLGRAGGGRDFWRLKIRQSVVARLNLRSDERDAPGAQP